ncbi:MAG: hypothetical protein E7052_04925 [Lentisphaerae bacterium]|nr:hypothetical protein [Lentisphaerota bacterium]
MNKLVKAFFAVENSPISRANPESCEVKFMQWNLHIAWDMQNKFNLKRQADVILEYAPDVVILNEVDKCCERTGKVDMTAVLGTLTGMPFTQFCGAWLVPPDGMYGNAVISRYKLNLVGAWHIPSKLEESRTMTLLLVEAPDPFYVAVTHLNAHPGELNNSVRVEAVKAIAELLEKYAVVYPVILGGDFNCELGSDPVNVLDAAGWKLEQPLKTWPSNGATQSLDHVFTRKSDSALQVVSREVGDAQGASDHLPVISNLKIYSVK